MLHLFAICLRVSLQLLFIKVNDQNLYYRVYQIIVNMLNKRTKKYDARKEKTIQNNNYILIC